MPNRLKTYYTRSDCLMLRRLMVRHMQDIAAKGLPIRLLLSGGMDSLTILYALVEAKVPFKSYTFYFRGVQSSDLDTVKRVRSKIQFDCNFVEFPSDWETLKPDIAESIKICRSLYGRIREVKVETILAYMLLKRAIPDKKYQPVNGDEILFMYTKNDAMFIAEMGDTSPAVQEARAGKLVEQSEETAIFDNIISPYTDKCAVERFLLGFSAGACNWKKPKSILYYAFEDYHLRCNSYRKPRPFQKASNEKAMFNRIAKEKGYRNALELFKGVEQGDG